VQQAALGDRLLVVTAEQVTQDQPQSTTHFLDFKQPRQQLVHTAQPVPVHHLSMVVVEQEQAVQVRRLQTNIKCTASQHPRAEVVLTVVTAAQVAPLLAATVRTVRTE
jgi:hypothetical protein